MCNESEDIAVQPMFREEEFRALNLCVIPVFIQVGDIGKFYDLLVDTGAQRTLVKAPVIKELGITEVRANARVSGATRNSQGCRIGQVDRLVIGEMDFPDFSIYIGELSKTLIKRRIDGCLGADVFGTTRLQIDYLMPLLEIARRVAS